ncbi:Asp-tRNA(Asn)/Glu-tRNA(Gln) amidotransferase subunit GatC [Endomicrobium proavitum]|uniref:Aspartyl/glutamyl-tRNA(Asn/Gln) amidotransferase subunit C n=1 Tax=Endomicrobium proavitum TaxID=1408281 RepID=A0A0G3WL25_9BACT|nr:Asp-tRNA(Asn)/Glu-tRNA(Gln) amidotransferase subunit GatC [Endomicrobium proavitum]AKL98204.1 Aspartyl/glutamyl-tRNA(Asn/Gln) amidotransferase subunit C [Endomicrobium proavitum]
MLKEELETTAFLARIAVKEEEKEKYLKDLNYMMEYIEILQGEDVSNLKPTTHVTELRNVWRDDVVRPCPPETVEKMLERAPEREGNFYKIKKVIDAQ